MAATSRKTRGSSKRATPSKNSGSKLAKKSVGRRRVARIDLTGKLVVAPNADGWVVKRFGSNRQRLFDEQYDAIVAAIKTARRSHTDLAILREDGTFRDWVSTSATDLAMLRLWKATYEANLRDKKR